MTAGVTAFWTDDEYDRDQVGDGISRFGDHVRRSRAVQKCWDGTWKGSQLRRVRFAEAAWGTAGEPVMSPGYVCRHPRVVSGRVQFNSWDSTLMGLVDLVVPWPQSLSRTSTWQRGGIWMDWPVDTVTGATYYRTPNEDEMTRYRYLMGFG